MIYTTYIQKKDGQRITFSESNLEYLRKIRSATCRQLGANVEYVSPIVKPSKRLFPQLGMFFAKPVTVSKRNGDS